jgi:hypothetical protein
VFAAAGVDHVPVLRPVEPGAGDPERVVGVVSEQRAGRATASEWAVAAGAAGPISAAKTRNQLVHPRDPDACRREHLGRSAIGYDRAPGADLGPHAGEVIGARSHPLQRRRAEAIAGSPAGDRLPQALG